ncbi:MAG TPA: glycosyltransferase, partial [Myxococcota bacterium]|nr:glycosyltransferase [Myxococcota bacterium]
KDHTTFFAAAAQLAADRRFDDVAFVLCGPNITTDNAALRTLWPPSLTPRLHLLGPQLDVRPILQALTLCTLTSTSEAMGMVLGEAMACGVPCVSTDVGDARTLVADTGRVVPIRDPSALRDAWAELLSLTPPDRHALGHRARERVIATRSFDAMCDAYLGLYR